MTKNPELTSSMISRRFFQCFGMQVSASHIRRIRQQMGWRCKQTSYCQLISQKNKKGRLKWCLDAYSKKEDFRNVIFTDESTVELRANGNVHFYKSSDDRFDKVPTKRPKPKHAYKVCNMKGYLP
ncbi:hypothetical protein FSP39_003632 [Pinctada imbricata]|uniref:Transposase Tc1-like domain-containing protein n=1 Tax=Pinctada imbricata TaxID=66713 RepID=A0AA88YKY1_PINIB|nr:hypothetical protein FSP39_003632 [Pinctada imbricata]